MSRLVSFCLVEALLKLNMGHRCCSIMWRRMMRYAARYSYFSMCLPIRIVNVKRAKTSQSVHLVNTKNELPMLRWNETRKQSRTLKICILIFTHNNSSFYCQVNLLELTFYNITPMIILFSYINVNNVLASSWLKLYLVMKMNIGQSGIEVIKIDMVVQYSGGE